MQRTRAAIAITTALLILSVCSAAVAETPLAGPAISEKDQPRADRWIAGHKTKLASLEAYVATKDPAAILEARIGSLNDLRREMLQPHPNVDFRAHSEFEACRQRLMQLRTDLARRGIYVGEWREWTFDGQTPGPDETKFLLSFEDKFNGVHGSHSPVDDKVAKMKDVLKRPEFGTNSILKIYKDTLGQHVMFGAVYRNALWSVKAVGNAFRSLKNDVDKNWKGCKGECRKRVHAEGAKLVAMIDQIKAAGLNLADFKVKLDEHEPLSDEWNLTKVRAESVKLSKK